MKFRVYYAFDKSDEFDYADTERRPRLYRLDGRKLRRIVTKG